MPDDYDTSNDEFLRPGFNPDDVRPDFGGRPGTDQPTNPQDGAGQRPISDTPPPQESMSLFTVPEESLLTKTNQYGGTQGQFGYRCESESTNWKNMETVNYWSTGSLNGLTSDNVLTLTSPPQDMQDNWITQLPDDFVNVGVAENSYVELSIVLKASYDGRADYSFTQEFQVCLEGGDSIQATVGDSLYNFSIVKGGIEVIDSGFVADMNAIWNTFELKIKMTEAVHCSIQDEYVSPTVPTEPIESMEDGGGYVTTPESNSLDQSSLYGILGVLVIIGMVLFIRAGIKGGSDGE
tara:strand:+ start:141 stop:1022 length:882 start_codon:yes stop_codon:yes gene_type:complete